MNQYHICQAVILVSFCECLLHIAHTVSMHYLCCMMSADHHQAVSDGTH